MFIVLLFFYRSVLSAHLRKITKEVATMSQETVKTALLNTINAIKENPNAAKAIFRANTELIKDVNCQIKVRNFEG